MSHSEMKHLHDIVMYMGKKSQSYALPAQLHVALQFQKVEGDIRHHDRHNAP